MSALFPARPAGAVGGAHASPTPRGYNCTLAVSVVACVVLALSSCGAASDTGLVDDIAAENIAVWDDVNDHGFSFPNFSPLAYEDVWFDSSDMVLMFGDSPDVCSDNEVADAGCVLTAEAAQFAQMVNLFRAGGHCEGFSIVAAQRFNAGLTPVTKALPDEPDVLRALMRGVSSQFLPEVQAEADMWLQASLRDKVLYVQDGLSGGELTTSIGVYTKESGHALLPYAVVWDSPDAAQIFAYDSNRPGMDTVISVDLEADRWEFMYSDGSLWAGGPQEMDITSIDRIGSCPFCGEGVELTATAFYIRSEFPDAEVALDGERIDYGDVTADAAVRPMRGFGGTLTRVSAYSMDERELRIDLPSVALVFAVTPFGIFQFSTQGGGYLLYTEDGIVAERGGLLAAEGNTAIEFVDTERAELSFADRIVRATVNGGSTITGQLPSGVQAVRIGPGGDGAGSVTTMTESGEASSFLISGDASFDELGDSTSMAGWVVSDPRFDFSNLDNGLRPVPIPTDLAATESDTSPLGTSTTLASDEPEDRSEPTTTALPTSPSDDDSITPAVTPLPTSTTLAPTPPATTTTTTATPTTTTPAPTTTTTTTTTPTTTTTTPTTTTTTPTTTTTTTVPPLAATASLSFDANGGFGAPSTVVDDPGATIAVAKTSPQRSGFAFNEWNTDPAGTGTTYGSGTDYTLPTSDGANDTLYAQWSPIGYTHVAGSALDGNGALQDGSVVELDIALEPGERLIFSNTYLMALMSSFASADSSEHLFIGVPSSDFDATSVTSSDFVTAFKMYRQSATNVVFEQHNDGTYGASLSRSATALTEGATFELSHSGQLVRLFDNDMDSVLSEDVASGVRHDVLGTSTTPRSVYIAAVGKGTALPATSDGAYKIAIPTPSPHTISFAGNVSSLIADSSSEIGHMAVNTAGDTFSVTRGGGPWISMHNSSAVEQWRIVTPVTGPAYLAAASDGGVYVAGLDTTNSAQVTVAKYDAAGTQVWSRTATTSVGSVEIMGLDVLEGSPDEAVVIVGKVAGGSGAELSLGSEIPGATVPSGHAEYLGIFDATTGEPQLVDTTYRGSAASTVKGFSSVDARPNGSGAWWVAVGGNATSTSNPSVACFRFTYDPEAVPPLVEDFSCSTARYAADVAVTSGGGVVAAVYGTSGNTSLQMDMIRFDNSGGLVWNMEVATGTYAPFPANSRGLDVDSTDNVYVAVRRVGNSTTFTQGAVTTVSTPTDGPNGLFVKLAADTGAVDWSRAIGSDASTKASTLAVSGTAIYLAASGNADVQYDATREWYTWKPTVFVFTNNGMSHR